MLQLMSEDISQKCPPLSTAEWAGAMPSEQTSLTVQSNSTWFKQSWTLATALQVRIIHNKLLFILFILAQIYVELYGGINITLSVAERIITRCKLKSNGVISCYWLYVSLCITISTHVNVSMFLSVLLTDRYVVFAHEDKPFLDYIYFLKRTVEKRLEKLSAFDPQVSGFWDSCYTRQCLVKCNSYPTTQVCIHPWMPMNFTDQPIILWKILNFNLTDISCCSKINKINLCWKTYVFEFFKMYTLYISLHVTTYIHTCIYNFFFVLFIF